MQLELGDIIQINSSELVEFHQQTYVITFLNSELLVVQNIITNTTSEFTIKNKTLTNKLIENINLLKRNSKKGFVAQNGFSINMWIDIHFNTTIPFVLTGKITNIEEDMIEIQVHSFEDEVYIYIDFAYQGIPLDSNISKIYIRNSPDVDISDEYDAELNQQQEKSQIANDIINIDKIVFHEDYLEAIEIKEQKEDYQQTYSLSTQINDLMEDILASNSQPSKELLNEIFIITERYKSLYTKYLLKKDSREKTIDKLLENNWIIPIIKNKQRLFISNEMNDNKHITNISNVEHISNLIKNLHELDTTNSFEDKYEKLLEIIDNFYKYGLDEYYLENVHEVKTPINTFIHNPEELTDELVSFGILVKENVPTIDKIAFKEQQTNVGDYINISAFAILPDCLLIREKCKKLSENILRRALVNDLQYYNYTIKKKNHYEQAFDDLHDKKNQFTSLFEKILHYIPSTRENINEKYIDNLTNDNIEALIIKHCLKKINHNNISLYSLLKELALYSKDKECLNVNILKELTEYFNNKILELKQKILDTKNIEIPPSDNPTSTFTKNYLDGIENYYDGDKYTQLGNSELISEMMNADNNETFISVILTKKNDMVDFAKFNKSAYKYLVDNDNIKLQKNKCNQYFLSKQYHTVRDLDADNSKDIYFDKEYDPTNYGMFTKEELDDDEKCIETLVTKYKIPIEEAKYEYESMRDNMRKVIPGQYALLYNDGQFIIFKRNSQNNWEPTTEFNGMDGTKIFCNIKSDCFATHKNLCANLNTAKKLARITEIKENINTFDSEIVMKKAEFKTLMINKYNQAMQQKTLHMINKKKTALIQNKLLYDIGTSFVPFEIIQSPFLDLFQVIINLKETATKYEYLIKFCANYTRDANPMNKDETTYWKYCIKTNIKLVPMFMYKLAISYHINDNYIQEMANLCKEQGVLSEDNDKFIDKYSGYVIKNIEYSDSYQSESMPIPPQNVLSKLDLHPRANDPTNSAYENVSQKNVDYITKIINGLCNKMYIVLNDDQLSFIYKNVTSDFVNFFKNKNLDKKQEQTVHSYYIMYFTLAYFSLEVLCAIPEIATKKQYPGCVKSFTGWPVTDKANISGIEYISCVAYKMAINEFPWKILRMKIFKKGVKSTPETISEEVQDFLDKIILKPAAMKKINKKINYLSYIEKRKAKEKEILLKKLDDFLPPQKPYKILFTLTKNYKNQSHSALQTKAYYYTISLNHNIQTLIKTIIDESDLVVDPIQEKINKNYDFFIHKPIYEDIQQLQIINKLLDEKYYPISYFHRKKYGLNYFDLFADVMQNEKTINDFVFSSLSNVEESLRVMYPTLPDDIPKSKLLFHELMKELNITVSAKELSKIYTANYEEKIRDADIFYKQITPVQDKLIYLLNKFPESVVVNHFYTLLTNENDIENIAVENLNADKETIKTYITDSCSYRSSNKKKLNEQLDMLFESIYEIDKRWKLIRTSEDEVNIFASPAAETQQNALHNIKNQIEFMYKTLPAMLLNNQVFDPAKIPDHWNVSNIHSNDIKDNIKSYYYFLEKYERCLQKDLIVELFEIFSKNTEGISELCDIILLSKDSYNDDTVYILLLYLNMFSAKMLIDLAEELNTSDALTCVSDYIYDGFNIFSFDLINTSYDKIYNDVNRIKESEKLTVTNMLKDMGEEERIIDNEFKKYGLGWRSKGQSKNVRVYEKDDYDDERNSEKYDKDSFMYGLLGDVFERNDSNIDPDNDIDFMEAIDMGDIPDDDDNDFLEE